MIINNAIKLEGYVVDRQLENLLEMQGIKNPSNLTENDIRKIPELLNSIKESAKENSLDQAVINEFYKFVSNSLPSIFESLNNLVSKHLGKEAMALFNNRIDSLNRKYEKEEDIEVLKLITKEISEILDRVEKESDKQRAWLTKMGLGALGAVVVVGGITVSIKNKDLGKRIASEGFKYLKG